MAKEKERFVRIFKQGSAFSTGFQIWVDNQTGVNYLVMPGSYGHSITPCLTGTAHP